MTQLLYVKNECLEIVKRGPAMEKTGESVKIIGLQYQGKIYYAIFLYMLDFRKPEEIEILEKQAGLSPYAGLKYLFMAPLENLGQDGEIVFSRMPGNLIPREPYILAFDFLRNRWADLWSGAIVDVDILVRIGVSGWSGDIDQYLHLRADIF